MTTDMPGKWRSDPFWRLSGVLVFVVLGAASVVLLATANRRLMQTVEQTVAATDNLMRVRYALVYAHLAWERSTLQDDTFEPLRSVAELDNASAHLTDLLEGRSALLDFTAEGLGHDQAVTALVSEMTAGVEVLRNMLAAGDGEVLAAVDVRLHFSRLETASSDLERRVRELVRARIADERRAQGALLFAWVFFLVATGVGIEILRRARARALAATTSAEARRSIAEADLGEAERRLQNLQALTDAGVMRVDADGRVLEMSRWWSRTVDMEASEWIGRFWWECLHPEEHRRMMDLWDDQSPRRSSFSLETRTRGAETGHDRWITAGWKPVEAAGVTQDGSWVGTFLDVTRHRSVEDQLHQAQKLEAIGRMTSGIAHDFNNLLTVMLTNAELLRSDGWEDPTAAGELVRDIEEAAESGRDLVAGLMRFSRKTDLEIARVDLCEVVRTGMKLADKLLSADVEVVLELPEPGPAVHADARAMQQVLFNLVTNARDAMPDGGRLVVSVDELDANASFVEDRPWIQAGRFGRITVTDNGTGMDRETLDQIFEPFFSTKAEGVGTGLGLASVHGLVRQHGGHVHAYSEPGVGTSFRIYLPIARAAAGVEAAPTRDRAESARGTTPARAAEAPVAGDQAPARVARSGVASSMLCVLLVEDDVALRRTSERVLVRLGHRVVSAGDGDEALTLMEEAGEDFDLVVSDISMERIDGLELVRRSREQGSRLPFILTSGRHASQLVGRSLLPEDVAFLQKPWSVETLKRAIREARLRA